MKNTIREELERFVVEREAGDGHYEKVSLWSMVEQAQAEAIAPLEAEVVQLRTALDLGRALLVAHDRVVNSKTVTRDDTFAMKTAADAFRASPVWFAPAPSKR